MRFMKEGFNCEMKAFLRMGESLPGRAFHYNLFIGKKPQKVFSLQSLSPQLIYKILNGRYADI
jgi:hypothetical protein